MPAPTDTSQRLQPRRLPRSNYKHISIGINSKNSESSVVADGSLFLVLEFYVGIDRKSESNNTTNISNNVQNVYIGYLLESDSREAAIFAFLSALAGSQATVFLPCRRLQ